MSTLLVVEDEYRLRKLVARTLEGQGHTVIEASNGVDAIALAGTFKNILAKKNSLQFFILYL